MKQKTARKGKDKISGRHIGHSKMSIVIPSLSVIILNINELNIPFKRHIVAEWLKKKKKRAPTIWCLPKNYFRYKDIHTLIVKEWRSKLHANDNQKKIGMAIVVSDNIYFKSNTITGDKEYSPA